MPFSFSENQITVYREPESCYTYYQDAVGNILCSDSIAQCVIYFEDLDAAMEANGETDETVEKIAYPDSNERAFIEKGFNPTLALLTSFTL